MKTGKQGLDLIKHYEGCKLNAYLCPSGIPTIGYGHTSNIKMTDVITQEQAESLLKQDLLPREKDLNGHFPNGLDQNKFDALISFIYNLGGGAFDVSLLLKLIKNNAENDLIYAEFLKWDKARVNGILKSLHGLTKRRKSEAELFCNNKLILL